MNRSELHTRLGLSRGVTFLRALGIEAVGVIDVPNLDGSLAHRKQVTTVLGGMCRAFGVGYAESVVVPRQQVIPFSSALPWAMLGAVSEMPQTAQGSLSIGLDLQPGQTLLIRGGTFALRLAAATLAKDRVATVWARTRQPERAAALHAHSVDHVIDPAGRDIEDLQDSVPHWKQVLPGASELSSSRSSSECR